MTRCSEVEIIITQKIKVDLCLAEEIKELNNVHNIDTQFCCCGHGGQGYIIVKDLDIEKMLSLGYKRTGRRYHNISYYVTDKRRIKDHEFVQWQFLPKSKCTCRG